jgi:Zn finger protein HypA/HybF involved in hydrogenase expression
LHELGITQGIIDHAREAAQANGAVRVTDLYLAMTPAADFAQDSIEMYFEMLAGDDDFFKGAKLHFDNRPITARCLACGEAFTVHARHEHCPRCASLTLAFDPEAPMVQLTDIGIDDGTENEGSGGA